MCIASSDLSEKPRSCGVSSTGEKTMLKSFFLDESGATSIEYALIAGIVSLAIIVALGVLGTNLSNAYQGFANEVAAANTL